MLKWCLNHMRVFVWVFFFTWYIHSQLFESGKIYKASLKTSQGYSPQFMHLQVFTQESLTPVYPWNKMWKLLLKPACNSGKWITIVTFVLIFKNKKQILAINSFLWVVKITANYLLIISSHNGSLLLLITFTAQGDLSSKPTARGWLLSCACVAGLVQILVICSSKQNNNTQKDVWIFWDATD